MTWKDGLMRLGLSFQQPHPFFNKGWGWRGFVPHTPLFIWSKFRNIPAYVRFSQIAVFLANGAYRSNSTPSRNNSLQHNGTNRHSTKSCLKHRWPGQNKLISNLFTTREKQFVPLLSPALPSPIILQCCIRLGNVPWHDDMSRDKRPDPWPKAAMKPRILLYYLYHYHNSIYISYSYHQLSLWGRLWGLHPGFTVPCLSTLGSGPTAFSGGWCWVGFVPHTPLFIWSKFRNIPAYQCIPVVLQFL